MARKHLFLSTQPSCPSRPWTHIAGRLLDIRSLLLIGKLILGESSHATSTANSLNQKMMKQPCSRLSASSSVAASQPFDWKTYANQKHDTVAEISPKSVDFHRTVYWILLAWQEIPDFFRKSERILQSAPNFVCVENALKFGRNELNFYWKLIFKIWESQILL